MENKNRLVFPDILRIVSIFGVIVLHSAAELLETIPIKSVNWIALISIDSLFRFAVPVFVMVSGMFMLSSEKDRGLKDLYFKKILRIVTSFAFWSTIYLFSHTILKYNQSSGSIKGLLKSFLIGEYHLWFMYMIVGLYIVTPLLRKIVTEKRTMQYFLAVWLFFCLLGNFVELVPKLSELATEVMSMIKVSVAVEYSGYYVLGYYLYKYPIQNLTKSVIYILGIIGTIVMCLLTIIYPSADNQRYFDYLLPMTAFQSTAIFILVKDAYSVHTPSLKNLKIITTLAQISFGVYLSHLLVLKVLKYIFISKLSLPVIVAFVIILVLTTIFSTLISYLLNKLPKANKYII